MMFVELSAQTQFLVFHTEWKRPLQDSSALLFRGHAMFQSGSYGHTTHLDFFPSPHDVSKSDKKCVRTSVGSSNYVIHFILVQLHSCAFDQPKPNNSSCGKEVGYAFPVFPNPDPSCMPYQAYVPYMECLRIVECLRRTCKNILPQTGQTGIVVDLFTRFSMVSDRWIQC